MSLFNAFEISAIKHFTPLHYLPYIARSGALLCKPSLLQQGFIPTHFRAKSHRQDTQRGFGDCAFLTLDSSARILKAKLSAGFPHIGISVPAHAIEQTQFSLCRYNVAMARQLKRGGKPGFPPSATNGRYYGSNELPTAKEEIDKRAMLAAHLPVGTMIEVLIHGDLPLPSNTEIVCFAPEDAVIASDILSRIGMPWAVQVEAGPGPYRRSNRHVSDVVSFIEQAMADPAWRGNGLDFDRL